LTVDINTLLAGAIDSIQLKILVFGPQVHTPSSDERTRKLQNKRVEIRQKLETLGHVVRYAEDLVDPTIGGPLGNAFLQELLIMREHDLIVTLVGSPGSIAEASVISANPQLASKASLFLDKDHVEGLVGSACENAKDCGAHFDTFAYPDDLDLCNLFGMVKKRVAMIQKIKYLS